MNLYMRTSPAPTAPLGLEGSGSPARGRRGYSIFFGGSLVAAGGLGGAVRPVLHLGDAAGILRHRLPEPPPPRRDDLPLWGGSGDGHPAHCAGGRRRPAGHRGRAHGRIRPSGRRLALLAAYTLAGGQVHVPMPGRRVGRTGPLGVYSLRVFSGVASSCCAPVLAGVIDLPTFDRRYVMTHGTDRGTLRKGPAHYPETPMPGQGGTVAVAGHRTTYLAPFRTIDDLARGDRIVLRMPYGRFTYRVEGTRIVAPTARGSSVASATSASCSPPVIRSTAPPSGSSSSRGSSSPRRREASEAPSLG